MLRNFSYGLLFLLVNGKASGQRDKPPISHDTYKTWASVKDPHLTNDGKYVRYTIMNESVNDNIGIVQSTETNWKKKGITGEFFTADNKKLIFKNEDSLLSLTLGSDKVSLICARIESYKRSMGSEWFAYQRKDDGRVILCGRSAQKIDSFMNVKQFEFSDEGEVLIIEMQENQDDEIRQSVLRISLQNLTRRLIWSYTGKCSARIGAFTLDKTATKLAFIVTPPDSSHEASIWYFDSGKKAAILYASNTSPGMPKGFYISALFSGKMMFNAAGDMIYFGLKKIAAPVIEAEKPLVIVWNYKDEKYPPEQGTDQKEYYIASLKHYKVTLLESDDETDFVFSAKDFPIGKYALSLNINYIFQNWHQNYCYATYLVSTEDGSRTSIIKDRKATIGWSELSPSEKFVVWFDRSNYSFFSFEIKTGIIRNISQKIPHSIHHQGNGLPETERPFGIAGWIENEDACLIYDRFDIWRVDLKGFQKPLNVTKGYGRQRHIVFGIIKPTDGTKTFSLNRDLVLGGFNLETKRSGVFFLKMSQNRLLHCNNASEISFIARTTPSSRVEPGDPPVKAKNAEAYITFCESTEKSPNLFFTKDFKTFRQISSVYPENNYNWLSAELIKWRMLDGNEGVGILYKPENFDPAKKYPLIFCYYEEQSDRLHRYLKPGLSKANLNIPQYVSNGYLIFVPDIFYTGGYPGKSAVNAVVSAAKYLSSFPWIDSTKMGLQGQSFGGFETNYIVTHSNIFSAACSGAGVSDEISKYGQGESAIAQSLNETGQSRIGGPPYAKLDLYIENSPVLHVQNASTPLLLWHGNQDNKVSFNQSLEMYINMRRAGKKVWLLQYPDGGHAFYDDRHGVDLDLRTRQFFDCYLKGQPAPLWLR